jgi:hypothetical protein
MNHASGKAEGMKHEKTPEGNTIALTISRSIKRKWQVCQTGKSDGSIKMYRNFRLNKHSPAPSISNTSLIHRNSLIIPLDKSNDEQYIVTSSSKA